MGFRHPWGTGATGIPFYRDQGTVTHRVRRQPEVNRVDEAAGKFICLERKSPLSATNRGCSLNEHRGTRGVG